MDDDDDDDDDDDKDENYSLYICERHYLGEGLQDLKKKKNN